jgi:hypothetical protein
MPVAELGRLWRRLVPLSIGHMPLRGRRRESCFGVAAELSKVHWVRLEMVEVSCAEWAPGRLLRQVVYLGEYGNKPATHVRRSPPG